MSQLPSATATRPPKDVFIQVQIMLSGEVLREINDRVDSLSDDNRLDLAVRTSNASTFRRSM